MDEVAAASPGRDLHIVLDNLNIHKNDAAKRWLEHHRRVHFHYTPTHASWVNMVECFLSILSKRVLAQSVRRSKQQLKDFLLKFLTSYNDSCQPFTWTKGLEKLQRIIEATEQYQAEHPPKRKRRQQRRNNIYH
jgi:transposase